MLSGAPGLKLIMSSATYCDASQARVQPLRRYCGSRIYI
jgi:hypothetical protein